MGDCASSPLSSLASSPIRPVARWNQVLLPSSSPPPVSPVTPQLRKSILAHVPQNVFQTPRRNRHRSNSDYTASTPHARTVLNGPPPPLSPLQLTPGFVLEAPIRGNADQRAKQRIQEGQKQRAKTIAANLVAKEQERLAQAEQQHQMNEETFKQCLDLLRRRKTTFGEFLMYVFDPSSPQGTVRWHEFAIIPGRVTQLLNWWNGAKSAKSVQNELSEWTTEQLCLRLAKQARHVTREGRLKTVGREIDENLISSFSFQNLYKYFCNEGGDLIVRVFEAITVTKNTHCHSQSRQKRNEMVVTSTILQCLHEHNNGNNLSQRMMGLYLYASGAQKQLIAVLSRLGITESYTSIIQNESEPSPPADIPDPPHASSLTTSNIPTSPPPTKKPPRKRIGTLQKLSASVRKKARTIASIGLFCEVYDNINFMSRTGEQAIGHHDSQENGTLVTIYTVWATQIEALQTSALRDALDVAPPLAIEDILHSHRETVLFRDCLIHGIIRIIVKMSQQDRLKAFSQEVEKHQPRSEHCITPHKTEVYPFAGYDIDEASIVSNVSVDEAFVEDSQLPLRPFFWKIIRLIAGDQLSIARLRSIQTIRAGHENGYEGFGWGVWMLGLFHTKMADIQGIFTTHFGKPTSNLPNPGSLHFHNTYLGRLPIVLTSLPPFSTCRNLVFVSLYARVLHCLLLVSGKSSLEEYAESIDSWDQLYHDAEKIFDEYANADTVRKLRDERELADEGESAGDMVFENGVLFLRDALISREMADAVRAGDSGRVLLVLKVWALSFRGNGCSKYAYEMLHLIHNIEKVWPKPVVDAVLNNWMVSTNGRTFLEVDLLQEHINYWVKVFYKAHGSNMSWKWLGMITPCINVLRQLAKTINEILGYDQGLRHAAIDTSKDIASLMVCLNDRNVYQLTQGRKLDEDQSVADVIAIGLEALTSGNHNPLHEYNEAFLQYQRRRRMCPVDLDDISAPSTPPLTPSPPSSPIPSPESSLEPDLVNNPHVSSHSPTCSDGTTLDVFAEDHGVLDELEGDCVGELAKILDDLEHGVVESTLGLAGEEDVMLDFEDEFDNEHAGNGGDDFDEESDPEPDPEVEEIGDSDMGFLNL
ncbi:hypothetical protein BDP27DRAFT_1547499 [Rhodocollybia butyracea]|uniref:DUF6589 domain-containing protein n=1 Tax=Rhodocollybia butyracea TaxID=206335 RepID=A0A9P5TVV0_9AGAR|nr:hypothetical protein BDP27DRAFT_1547499 [Rhodocollybia butyracea]